MNLLKGIIFSLLVMLYADAAFADAQITSNVYKVDKNRSKVEFTAVMNDAPSKGSFDNVSGNIFYDKNDISFWSANILVNIPSVETVYPSVKPELEKPEWLNYNEFKLASFKAVNFKPLENGKFLASGNLTVKDITLPQNITFEIEELEGGNLVVKGEFNIDRLDYKVGIGQWEDTSTIENKVEVKFTIYAELSGC